MFELELLDYRDPLIGIIVIFIIVFIASFLTYSLNIYKEKQSRQEYRKLLQRFELGTLKEEDYTHLYSTYNLPFDSIILLASTFIYEGKHNKAISVYLALLEHVKEPVKKEELLELLGNAYFKSGLLQRSKDIYLKILKFRPRNKIALKHLLLIFQNLNEYKRANEVLDALEELDEDTIKERIYLNILTIIDDPVLSFEKKSTQLFNNYTINKNLERVVAHYLIKFNKELFWDNIEQFNPIKIIDYLWYLDFDDINWDKVSSTPTLQEIYSAKGHINSSKSSEIFELNALISIKNSSVKSELDLNFEFICKKCKKTHPIFEIRCPHCNDLFSFVVEPKLGKPTINLASLV
jgi:tetratricopeptide (TPR) repeat protein